MTAELSARDWRVCVTDAAWLPYACDLDLDHLTFAHLPRAAHRTAVFLDPRYIGDASQSMSAPLSALAGSRIPIGPLHFIFHTAFCCSTLIARALDAPGASMGLREPAILTPFADRWTHAPSDERPSTALKTVLNLLSRPFAPGETQIVKASNTTNHIAARAMMARPDAKVLLMHSSLETFLRAIVRRGVSGHNFARAMHMQFAPAIPLRTTFTVQQQLLLADLQIAAHAWLMQAAWFESLARRFPNRVRMLGADALLADPAAALEHVGAFFDLVPKDWRAIVDGPIFANHAKEPGRPFDDIAYRRQALEIAPGHDRDVREAMQWASGLAAHCGAPLTLGDSLLA